MEEYIIALVQWALSTEWGAYVMVALAFVGFIGKLLAVLPVSVTEKLPDWLMTIINVLGAHWGNGMKTDIKGNVVNGNGNTERNTSANNKVN